MTFVAMTMIIFPSEIWIHRDNCPKQDRCAERWILIRLWPTGFTCDIECIVIFQQLSCRSTVIARWTLEVRGRDIITVPVESFPGIRVMISTDLHLTLRTQPQPCQKTGNLAQRSRGDAPCSIFASVTFPE